MENVVLWLVEVLPNWVWYLLFAVSVCLYIISHFAGVASLVAPNLKLYQGPIKIISLFMLMASIWLFGANASTDHWQKKIRELEKKVKIAEEKGNTVTTVVQTKVVKDIQIVSEKADEIIRFIDRDKEIVKFVEVCKLPEPAISAHNAAALNKPELLKGNK